MLLRSLREFLRDGPWEIFDSLIVAMQREMLLVTDDAPTREFARRFGFDRSTWLQPAFMVADNRNKIDFDTYVKWTAHLIGTTACLPKTLAPTTSLAPMSYLLQQNLRASLPRPPSIPLSRVVHAVAVA